MVDRKMVERRLVFAKMAGTVNVRPNVIRQGQMKDIGFGALRQVKLMLDLNRPKSFRIRSVIAEIVGKP